MKKAISFSILILLFSSAFAQSQDELAVRKVLSDQVNAWNRGSINDFMKGYWKNDSLSFVSHDNVTYGYNKMVDHYKKTYKDTTAMGKLFFALISVKKLSPEYYFVIGKWMLKRSIGDIGGNYTLLFRKINSKWVIITDHTS